MVLYPAYDETKLLDLLAQSDHDAFAEIYRRYWDRMMGMAVLRLKRTDQAEDIVQDVFTSLWKRREEITVDSLEAWLATAVKFKVINLVNRRLKKEIYPGEVPEMPCPDHLVNERLLEKMIATEINRLPEKCKIVFHYSRQLGYTNREIAEEFNISEKTVEMHITKARHKLSLSLRGLLHSVFLFF